MISTNLIHPEILKALASGGHGSKILIADGNFPISTCPLSECKKVFLNLSRNVLTVMSILHIIAEYVPIEQATVIVPANGQKQHIHDEFAQLLGKDIPMEFKKRMEFYQEVRSTDTLLAIASGDTRRFANILLTIGCERSSIT